MRDEGYQRLQSAIDHSQVLIPNTAPMGKDEVRASLHRLQQGWEDILNQLTSSKTTLEAALGRWELYDDTSSQLAKWLQETENAVKVEAGLRSSLPEKRAQHDRIKVSQSETQVF